ncbi:hypothetical protein T439DRAFT_381557 [Meredithblackwellia eburnea MCA 4105]
MDPDPNLEMPHRSSAPSASAPTSPTHSSGKRRVLVSSSRPWTKEEESELHELCYGQRHLSWRAIALKFPGRSARAVETKWNAGLNKPAFRTDTDQSRAPSQAATPESSRSREASQEHSSISSFSNTQGFLLPRGSSVPSISELAASPGAWTSGAVGPSSSIPSTSRSSMDASILQRFPFASKHYRFVPTATSTGTSTASSSVNTPAPEATTGTVSRASSSLASLHKPERVVWTEEEDIYLRELCTRPKKRRRWADIAKHFVGKDAEDVEFRWTRQLRRWGPKSDTVVGIPRQPEVSKPLELDSNAEPQLKRWTLSDDNLLRSVVATHTRINWPEVARHFPARSKTAVQSRWKSINLDSRSMNRTQFPPLPPFASLSAVADGDQSAMLAPIPTNIGRDLPFSVLGPGLSGTAGPPYSSLARAESIALANPANQQEEEEEIDELEDDDLLRQTTFRNYEDDVEHPSSSSTPLSEDSSSPVPEETSTNTQSPTVANSAPGGISLNSNPESRDCICPSFSRWDQLKRKFPPRQAGEGRRGKKRRATSEPPLENDWE